MRRKEFFFDKEKIPPTHQVNNVEKTKYISHLYDYL